jgi:hypothetical protein
MAGRHTRSRRFVIIERPTVPIREHPRALELFRGPLSLEGLLDDWQHLDVAFRLYGFGRSLAETADWTSHPDRPPSPVDVVPLEADLLAGPESGEEGDAEVTPILIVVQALGDERLDLAEGKRLDLRFVLAQEVNVPRRIVLEPSLGHGAIKRLPQDFDNDVYAPIRELLRSPRMLAPVSCVRHGRCGCLTSLQDGDEALNGLHVDLWH